MINTMFWNIEFIIFLTLTESEDENLQPIGTIKNSLYKWIKSKSNHVPRKHIVTCYCPMSQWIFVVSAVDDL